MRMKRQSFAVSLLIALIGTSFSTAIRADTPAEQYRQAVELYNARLYTTAAQELKKFLDTNPTDSNAKIAAYQWAGALYRTENNTTGVDYPAAIKAYQWALQKYPAAPANIVSAARFELGEALYLSKKPEQTISVLTEFLKNPSVNAQTSTRLGWANYYLGKSYIDLKKPAPARAAFERVRSKFASTEAAPDALLELGLLNLAEGKNAEAITIFANLRTKFPNSQAAPEAQVHLGEAQLDLKNYAAARETLRAALSDTKAAEFKTDILQALANIDFAEKKWDVAAQSYALLLQSLPANDSRRLNAQLQRGNAFFNAKNWAAAIENYAPLLKSEAKIGAPALYYSAGSLLEQSNFTTAASLYRQFLTSFPTHDLASKAALRLGDALANAKDPTGAAEAYKVVLIRFPSSDSAKGAQSALLSLAGTVGASVAVESALRGLPAGAAGNTQLRLAQVALERGDFTKSAQLANVVLAAKPDPSTLENALYLLGSAKLNAKDAAGAATVFSRQVAAFPKGKLAAQGNLGLAWAYEDQKKWVAAEKAARAALLIGGEKDRAQLVLANALLNSGKFAPAAAAFAVTEKSTNKSFAAQSVQGAALALEKQNLWREAATKWARRAALMDEPDAKSRSYLRQGLALGKAKDNANAQLAFDAAASASANSEIGAQALYEAAWLANDAKQSDVENARWIRLETEFPTSKLAPEAIFQQGELALSNKKWEEAATTFGRLLQKYPTGELTARAHFSRGTAYYNAQKWNEAATAFDKVGDSSESLPLEALFWAGESFRKSGNLAQAEPRYRRFVQTIEASTTAPTKLKTLIPSARLGWGQTVSPAQAALIYQTALASAQGKTKTELSFRLGQALTTQSKWAQALPILLPVATSETQWSAPAQWLTAQALGNTGAKSDALALYQKLAASQPSNEWTEKATVRVKELAQ
jgi:TolA-binding protein